MNLFNKITYLILFVALFTSAKAQHNGVILSKIDSTPLAQAHIINLTKKTGVVSNDKGEFTITPQSSDSIAISMMGFYTLKLIGAQLTDTVYLEQRNYVLELYNVIPYKTFAEFKEAFVKLELPDTFKHINPTIYLSKEELIGIDRGSQQGVILTGIVSSLFAAFNKRMKDKANYEMLLLRDEYEAFLATKFNPDLVKRITELNDRTTLEDFIDFCDFSNDFIANNSNYTIITRTFECYDEYLNLPLASK